jgi:histidyl-tRNA synthetase
MYTFEDRGGDSITLRPEFTAGIARAYLTEGWKQHAPLKIATHGPVFRYERPQKGRFRQFHQLDAEIIGAAEPQADVELLALADQLLKELKIDDGVTLQLNTLGDQHTREGWRFALIDHFANYGDLSDDSRARLERNPLRILDSKDPRDRAAVESAPGIDLHLTPFAQTYFDAVRRGLDNAGVKFEWNKRLVRGLDYYRHTAFEFITDRLGAQGTVLAGGRYDGLIGQLGGPETPGVGWAAGIERLAMLLVDSQAAPSVIAVIAETEEFEDEALRQVSMLRASQLPAQAFVTGSPRKRYDRALKTNPSVTISLNRRDGAPATGVRRLRITDDEMDAIRKALSSIDLP